MASDTTGPDPLSGYSKADLNWAYAQFLASYPPEENQTLSITDLEISPHRQQLLLDVARYSKSCRIRLRSDTPIVLANAVAENDSVLMVEVNITSAYMDNLRDAIATFVRRQDTRLLVYFYRGSPKLLTMIAGSNLVSLTICGYLDHSRDDILGLADILASLHQLRELSIFITKLDESALDYNTVVRLALSATSSQYLHTLSIYGVVMVPVIRYLYDHVLPINNTIKDFQTSLSFDSNRIRRILGSNWCLNKITVMSDLGRNLDSDWGRKRVRSFVASAAAAAEDAAEANPTPAAEILFRALPEMFEGRPDRNLATRILCAYHRANIKKLA